MVWKKLSPTQASWNLCTITQRRESQAVRMFVFYSFFVYFIFPSKEHINTYILAKPSFLFVFTSFALIVESLFRPHFFTIQHGIYNNISTRILQTFILPSSSYLSNTRIFQLDVYDEKRQGFIHKVNGMFAWVGIFHFFWFCAVASFKLRQIRFI